MPKITLKLSVVAWYVMCRGLLPLLICGCLFSCSKEKNPPGTSSLTIVNAIAGSDMLVANFSGTVPLNTYLYANRLPYNFFSVLSNQFSAYSGQQPLAIYAYPDTLEKSTPLFNMSLHLPVGSIHSLFLTGTMQHPDTMLVTDLLPVYLPEDSVTGIRFVNLSPGSAPVSINIQGQTGSVEVSNLPYKGITGFKRYAAKTTSPDYVFEFRDAGSGALIASYQATGISNPGTLTPNNWRNRNVTLALLGNQTLSVLLINNY
ncbi:MAG: DUF4397 domain-containing protein [Chitinophaga sp.]|uniref:hypothetical protein n=1 Tax=Chitinophaga sp. TaxID=1869181 RepID=UPI001B229C6C|nr:hypothetical protein [Chitinophaga sp.]MBO9728520.1 DUF4397 domain-containing protein [Chitinophaga sp.]